MSAFDMTGKPGRGLSRCARGLVVGLAFSICGVLLTNGAATPPTLTVSGFRTMPDLSVKRFCAYFSEFRYEFREQVQPPDVFLARRAGDCDDYAVVADLVLRERGHVTRLVAVRMAGLLTHVVCHVAADRVYLDYNQRVYLIKTQRCGPALEEIADRVARSLGGHWTSVSEFTFRDGLKRLVATKTRLGLSPAAAPSRPTLHTAW